MMDIEGTKAEAKEGAAAADAAQASMVQAAQALAMTGVDVALDPDLLRRAREEFVSGRGSP